MTDTQPEALRLADELDAVPETGADPQTIQEAAAELRRLHAYCQELESHLILDCMTHIQNPAPQPSPAAMDRLVEAFERLLARGESFTTISVEELARDAAIDAARAAQEGKKP